jgi:transposase, IS30 family
MKHLTEGQRYEIEALRKANVKQKEIARILGRHKSVISREISRNSDQRSGDYRASLAERKCRERHASKPKCIYFTDEIKEYVNNRLSDDYSPEQIAGEAKSKGIKCVSHERIYQHIWANKRNKGVLYKHLRQHGKRYRKRGASKDKRGQIVGRNGIENRPQIVEKKERIGDLEADLVIGKNHKGALLTINDRATGMLYMKKIESKEAAVVEQGMIELLGHFQTKIHTVTTDNGKEFANHAKIAEKLDIDYYFARPYHSWERGANENLNGLIRQYFPKGSDFEHITHEQVNHVIQKLNNRPRKRFGYLSPTVVLNQAIINNGQVAFIT